MVLGFRVVEFRILGFRVERLRGSGFRALGQARVEESMRGCTACFRVLRFRL